MTAISMQAKVNYAVFVLHKAGMPRRDVAKIISDKNKINKDNVVKKAEEGSALLPHYLAPRNANFRNLTRAYPENIENISTESDIFK